LNHCVVYKFPIKRRKQAAERLERLNLVQWIMINGRKLTPIAVDPGHDAPAGKRRRPPRHQPRLLPCRSLCLPVLLAHQAAASCSSLSVEARRLTDTKHFSCRCTSVVGFQSLMGIDFNGVEPRSAGFAGPERLLVRVFMLHMCCLTIFFVACVLTDGTCVLVDYASAVPMLCVRLLWRQ